MVDWSKVKKSYIPASEVPSGHGAQSPWDKIFEEIPKGQALVLHEPDVSAGTVRQALHTRHRKGKFKNLRMSTKGRHGIAVIYVTNIEKATPTPTITRKAHATPEQQKDTQTS